MEIRPRNYTVIKKTYHNETCIPTVSHSTWVCGPFRFPVLDTQTLEDFLWFVEDPLKALKNYAQSADLLKQTHSEIEDIEAIIFTYQPGDYIIARSKLKKEPLQKISEPFLVPHFNKRSYLIVPLLHDTPFGFNRLSQLFFRKESLDRFVKRQALPRTGIVLIKADPRLLRNFNHLGMTSSLSQSLPGNKGCDIPESDEEIAKFSDQNLFSFAASFAHGDTLDDFCIRDIEGEFEDLKNLATPSSSLLNKLTNGMNAVLLQEVCRSNGDKNGDWIPFIEGLESLKVRV